MVSVPTCSFFLFSIPSYIVVAILCEYLAEGRKYLLVADYCPYKMFNTIRILFYGLAWFFGGLAGLFLLFFLITNTSGFMANIMNPLIVIYFVPAIICFWIAEWADKKIKPAYDFNDSSENLNDHKSNNKNIRTYLKIA